MDRILNIQQGLIRKNLRKLDFHESLKGKTVLITGGSRGIGLAFAKRCAKDGANVAILAKSTEENPKIPGTIFSAAKEIEAAGGKALPLKCDIRFEEEVKKCVEQVVAKFGGIDIVINNASAIDISNTSNLTMKK
jgi:citronellol/citronellal dehydrogenase